MGDLQSPALPTWLSCRILMCALPLSYNPQEIINIELFPDTLGMNGFEPPTSHQKVFASLHCHLHPSIPRLGSTEAGT